MQMQTWYLETINKAGETIMINAKKYPLHLKGLHRNELRSYW